MWLLWSAATFTLLFVDPAHSNAGIASTSFSNELRSGFTRLFRNGIEQPAQTSYILINPIDFQTAVNPLIQQRPASFNPLTATGYHIPRPRYELESLSWMIPYYYVPTRYNSHRGGRKQNDVLVLVVKIKSNCTTTTSGNGTEPTDGNNDDDDDSDDDDGDNNNGLNPDVEVESVAVVAGGTEKGKEPSRCVWAILSCCAPANTPIRYTCFDVLGCSTAFWDTNPCVPAITKTALDQATMYYAPITNGTRAADPATTQTPAASNTVTMDLMAALTAGTSTTGTAAPIVVQTQSTPAATAT